LRSRNLAKPPERRRVKIPVVQGGEDVKAVYPRPSRTSRRITISFFLREHRPCGDCVWEEPAPQARAYVIRIRRCAKHAGLRGAHTDVTASHFAEPDTHNSWWGTRQAEQALLHEVPDQRPASRLLPLLSRQIVERSRGAGAFYDKGQGGFPQRNRAVERPFRSAWTIFICCPSAVLPQTAARGR
jgi:hypothetical protein